jgi:hypothetical protein
VVEIRNGRAAFDRLFLDSIGTYAFQAVSLTDALLPDVSISFKVLNNEPARLEYAVAPHLRPYPMVGFDDPKSKYFKMYQWVLKTAVRVVDVFGNVVLNADDRVVFLRFDGYGVARLGTGLGLSSKKFEKGYAAFSAIEVLIPATFQPGSSTTLLGTSDPLISCYASMLVDKDWFKLTFVSEPPAVGIAGISLCMLTTLVAPMSRVSRHPLPVLSCVVTCCLYCVCRHPFIAQPDRADPGPVRPRHL